MDGLINYLLIVVYFLSFFFVVFWLITLITEPEKSKPKKLKKFPNVTIGIPAYNEEDNIQETLQSAINLDYPKDKLEIIVVNDGSKDKTKQKVNEFIKNFSGYDIKQVNQKNQGKAAALNKAIKISRGEFFVVLDADSCPQKDALKVILPHFSQGEDVAAVLPCMKVKENKKFVQKIQHYEYLVNMFYKEIMGKLDCIRVAPGPFSVYRKSVFKKVGGFERNNIAEDLEMAIRLQKNQFRLIQTMKTNVFTNAPNNLRDLLKQRNRWYKGSLLNSLKYKKMIFKKKFGDFGMMQMPITLFSGVLTLTIVLSSLYLLIRPIMNKIHQFGLINFDFSSILLSFKNALSSFHILDLDYVFIALGATMLLISLFILKKAHLKTKEKIFKYGAIPLIGYMLIYFLILGITWIKVGIDLLFKKEQTW